MRWYYLCGEPILEGPGFWGGLVMEIIVVHVPGLNNCENNVRCNISKITISVHFFVQKSGYVKRTSNITKAATQTSPPTSLNFESKEKCQHQVLRSRVRRRLVTRREARLCIWARVCPPEHQWVMTRRLSNSKSSVHWVRIWSKYTRMKTNQSWKR